MEFEKVPDRTWQVGVSYDLAQVEKYFFFAFGWWVLTLTIGKDPLKGWFFYTRRRKG